MPKKLILPFFVLLLLLPAVVTAQPENIIISEHTIMVHQVDKRARVYESMAFSNIGGDAFFGELVAALPSGARNIMVTMPIDDAGNLTVVPYVQRGDNIYWDSKIDPHETVQINVAYQPDVQTSGVLQKSTTVEKELRYYTQLLSVVVITTTKADVTAPPLVAMGPSIYNEEFDAYVAYLSGSSIMPQKIVLTIKGPEMVSYDAILLAGVICIVAALIAVQVLRSKEIKFKEIKLFEREDAKTLEKKKTALLTVLNELERDYKAKKINKAEYQDLKSKYEKEAIRIMKKLDRIKE
ncbi:MAG: hypothetical protein QMC78_02585 [Methanocellales archaeon]|nr:hypothetical protein [Methanocellales archaeon]